MDVIVAIGHDGSPDPEGFKTGVRGIIVAYGELAAEINGSSADEIGGTEPATWFACSFPNLSNYTLARQSILNIAAMHGQDAVAFTTGEVDVAETVNAQRAAS